LQKAAIEIVRKHVGRFPRKLEGALELPGVGGYTAAAVLSIAYGAPLAVLDGNVARVLARLGAVRGDLRRSERWRELEATAQRLLAVRTAGAWNQAMMELGATVCMPRSPACGECPVAHFCRARELGLQETLPEKRAKRAPEDVRLAAAVLLDAQRLTVLVKPHNGAVDGLFSRMWQFPAVRVSRDAEGTLRRCVRHTLGAGAADFVALPAARHAVTYRRVVLLPFLVAVDRLPPAGHGREGAAERTTIPLEEVERMPTSSATRKIARAAIRQIAREIIGATAGEGTAGAGAGRPRDPAC